MANLLFQDVIEQIVSHLQHDKFSLARLRLISHDWDVPCRALLFNKIELKALDPLDYLYLYGDVHQHGSGEHYDQLEKATQDLLSRCNALLDLFRSRPCLGSIPREVVLVRAHKLKPSIWGTLEPVYTKVLEHLNCIQKIHLREVHFSHLSEAFLGALLEVFRQPTVTHCNFVSCPVDDGGLFKEITRAPKYLKHLALSGASSGKHGQAKTLSDPQQPEHGGGEPPTPNDLTSHTGTSSPCDLAPSLRGRVRLETLAIELASISTFVEHLFHSVVRMDLSELKGLWLGHIDNVTNTPADFGAVETILGACASTVEFLSIGARSGESSVSASFCFGCNICLFPLAGGCKISKEEIQKSAELFRFPRLRTIRFSGACFTENGSHYFFLGLALCLSTISPASELRMIDAQGYIDSTMGSGIDWESWRQVDEALSNRRSFPFFEALTISLAVTDIGHADVFVSMLRQQLPTISGRGHLSITLTD